MYNNANIDMNTSNDLIHLKWRIKFINKVNPTVLNIESIRNGI